MKNAKEADTKKPNSGPKLLNSRFFLDKEQKYKLFISKVRKAGRFFEIADWFIVAVSVYFFVNLYPFRFEPAFLFINLLALSQSLIYHRLIFSNLHKNKPKLALNIDISFFLLMAIFLAELLGGITSPASFIFIAILLISAFCFNPYFLPVILFLELGIIYFFILGDPHQLAFLGSHYNLFIWELFIIIISFIAFFALGYFYFNKKKEWDLLESMANQLTADKVKSEAVLQSMSDGVFVVDRERRIIFLNDAAEKIIKSQEPKEKFIGHFYGNVFKFLREGKLLDYTKDCPLQLAIDEGKPNSRNDLSLEVFKKPVFITMSAAPIIDAAGDARGAVAVLRDITKEKEVERIQMEFVSIASHELLTPITQVQGHLSMMVEEKIGKMDATAEKLAGNAFQGIKRISRLVKDLMNISRIERGAMKITPTSFDLIDFINNLIKEFQDEFTSAELKLEFKKPNKASLNIYTDQDRIGEVLTNLIGNAIKFTKAGRITISLAEKKEGFVVISVSDTGIGIPKENISQLFDKFYQVDSSATREAQGTGLGLYISKTIVEMLGGKIWVESKLGEGSIFYFSIPLKANLKTEDNNIKDKNNKK